MDYEDAKRPFKVSTTFRGDPVPYVLSFDTVDEALAEVKDSLVNHRDDITKVVVKIRKP